MIFDIYWDRPGKNLENNGVNEDFDLLHFGKHATKMKKTTTPLTRE